MNKMKWVVGCLVLMFCSVVNAAGQVAADFSFQDLDGKPHRLSDYRGKWVIVNYWSKDCSPCIQEIPVLKGVAQRYRNTAVVLGLDVGETPIAQMKQFVRQRGINYLVAPTQDSTMFALGLIYGVPTTYIISPKGEIVDTHMGAITAQQLQRYLSNR
ncbi:TlpA family protein disulfide reductase [Thiofilum flexile]|uniref:TlpA family protein disulfide reductase n=1 Tax=Thiofilum flexile TaxID=125627 RepID=UPI00037C80C4|nr:TlpA disulfide reductase family protein [Thiofilum flexile]